MKKSILVILLSVIFLLLIYTFKSYHYIQELRKPEEYHWKRMENYLNLGEKTFAEVNFDSTNPLCIELKKDIEDTISELEEGIKGEKLRSKKWIKKRRQHIFRAQRILNNWTTQEEKSSAK